MTTPVSYFCPECGDIKEERYFRKCEDCGELQKADEPSGAYNCNLHDHDDFYIKNKKIVCRECNYKKEEPEKPKLEIQECDN